MDSLSFILVPLPLPIYTGLLHVCSLVQLLHICLYPLFEVIPVRKPPGPYHTLHEGHMAAIAQLNDTDEPFDLTQLEYVLLAAGESTPHTFDEAL